LDAAKAPGKPAGPARERSDGWGFSLYEERFGSTDHDCPSVAMVDASPSASGASAADHEGQLAGKKETGVGVCLTCSLAALLCYCTESVQYRRPDLQSFHFRPLPSLSKLPELPRLALQSVLYLPPQ